MTWVKLDDGFADHPKIERAGPLAAWLHVVAMCYCARHLTDGIVPKSKAKRLADIPSVGRHIAALVDAGLWEDAGENYVLHDYLDYQPSRTEVLAERAQARDRMAKRRREPNPKLVGSSPEHPENNGRSSGTPVFGDPDPSRPIQVKGGENLRAAAPGSPPSPRCPAHSGLPPGEVPACGNCADARRAYETWTRETNTGTPDPYADMQAAARQHAEAGTTKAHEIASEPADPQAAAKIADLLRTHRLATRQDPT
jgi:hypothetical protein